MYYLVYGLLYLISLLPFFILYRISELVFLLMYHLFGYRKKVVLENLRNSFPDKSEQEIKQIGKGFYKNFCDVIRGQRFQYQDAASGEKRGVHFKTRVLGRGAHQYDRPVLHVGKKGVLLAPVEPVDLIHK